MLEFLAVATSFINIVVTILLPSIFLAVVKNGVLLCQYHSP
jgi:hypothetical protein